MANSDYRIIYTNDNGFISIVIPVDEEECGETLEQIRAKTVPNGKTSYIVNKSEVPSDRSFRNAWTYTE
tara:strand:+ start:247 stop:453 length:207 start_codon:yes stop_codon:yes gene_type:complete